MSPSTPKERPKGTPEGTPPGDKRPGDPWSKAFDWIDADRELEQLIESAGATRDEDLIRLFHRRTLRHESLLQPVLRELEGVKTQLLDG